MSVNANIEPAPNMAEKSLLADMIQKGGYLSDEDQKKFLLDMIETGMSNVDRSESGSEAERLQLAEATGTHLSNADRSESGPTMAERLQLAEATGTHLSNADRSESGPTMAERLQLAEATGTHLSNADRSESGPTMAERLQLAEATGTHLSNADRSESGPTMAERLRLAEATGTHLSDDREKNLSDMMRTGMSDEDRKKAELMSKMTELGNRVEEIGREYPDSGLMVSGIPDGMILKLNHEGRQTHFSDISQDVFEDKWPGLFDRLSDVLDKENDLWQERNFAILEGGVKKIAHDYPKLEISVLNCSDGMVLMIEHEGRQVNFDSMRFDVLEENWPGLSDRLCKVLDDEIVRYQDREAFMGNRRIPNCEIIVMPGNTVSKPHDQTPSL